MGRFFQPRLVNGPAGDPALFVDFRFGAGALLVDAGDLSALSPRELGRVGHLFVSHAHMDHFAGFDRLLRLRLHRAGRLRVVGPACMADRVGHRLASYDWNLLGAHSVDFAVEVLEFADGRLAAGALFAARDAFRRRDMDPPRLRPGTVMAGDQVTVEAAELDHGIPSLAFALRETVRVNVWRAGLDRLGLPVGAWLEDAKHAARRGLPDDTAIAAGGERTVPLGLLREHALRLAPGEGVGYVTDAACTQDNLARAADLVRGVDRLFVETPFLEEDADQAARRRHLTAACAGRLAAAAGVGRLIPFHFSPRYLGREAELAAEAEAALRAGTSGAA